MSSKKSEDDSKYYFTEEHEEAIEKYIKADEYEMKKKEKLYRDYIGPVFEELIENIVNTYNFEDLENVEKKKEECKVWLMTMIDKYDPDANSKAFSYFSVVVRNWFTQKMKEHSKKKKKQVDYDDIPKYIEEDYLIENDLVIDEIEKREFFEHLVDEIKRWVESDIVRRNLGDNDIKVANAILDLFEHTDEVDMLDKKSVYFYIRQMTDLNTKQVSRSLKKLKDKYKIFKRKWKEDRIE